MNIGGFIQAEFNTSCFCFFDCAGQIFMQEQLCLLWGLASDRAVRAHGQAARFAHHIWGGDGHIKIGEPILDFLDPFIVICNMSAPASFAAAAPSPSAKTKTRTVLPKPCGRLTTSLQLLVCLARV